VGERHQKSPAQVAIRWVLDYTSVSCAITGAKSPAQIEDNVGALGWSLTQDECRYLAGGARTS
jgi:aryl-alcohol dehydrogenase-like predicted oxidoreductase